jgi:uncharacterized protein (TIGR02246 family)
VVRPTISEVEHAVRELERRYDAAWCRGDIDALLECFAPDASILTPSGELLRGHEEIRAGLLSLWSSRQGAGVHESEVLAVHLLAPGVALADGIARLGGSGGSSAPELSHRFSDIVRLRAGRWVVAHVRAWPASVPPQSSQQPPLTRT